VRRRGRVRRGLPIISIVGYTNAGKSTLLNAITHSQVLAEDRLFATLDPASRRLRFPEEREVIITDTVGFIRDLPPDLVSAFRATLEELSDASLLLHVVDAADPSREEQVAAVERILGSLGLQEKPRLMVWNKADLLPEEEIEPLLRQRGGVAISAHHRQGLEALLAKADRTLFAEGSSQRLGALAPAAALMQS
jgi:GTP-binding protein HflX